MVLVFTLSHRWRHRLICLQQAFQWSPMFGRTVLYIALTSLLSLILRINPLCLMLIFMPPSTARSRHPFIYNICAFLFFLFYSICGHCCKCYQPANSRTGLTWDCWKGRDNEKFPLAVSLRARGIEVDPQYNKRCQDRRKLFLEILSYQCYFLLFSFVLY